MEEKNLYTIQEVANLSGVSKSTLMRWAREGKIKEPARDGRNWRIWTKEGLEEVTVYKRRRTHEVKDKLGTGGDGP